MMKKLSEAMYAVYFIIAMLAIGYIWIAGLIDN